MTLETLNDVVIELKSVYGIGATLEYPGYIEIPFRDLSVQFGDSNQFYGASVMRTDGTEYGYIDTPLASDCDDAELIAYATQKYFLQFTRENSETKQVYELNEDNDNDKR
jgi:hypothetical protein